MHLNVHRTLHASKNSWKVRTWRNSKDLVGSRGLRMHPRWNRSRGTLEKTFREIVSLAESKGEPRREKMRENERRRSLQEGNYVGALDSIGFLLAIKSANNGAWYNRRDLPLGLDSVCHSLKRFARDASFRWCCINYRVSVTMGSDWDRGPNATHLVQTIYLCSVNVRFNDRALQRRLAIAWFMVRHRYNRYGHRGGNYKRDGGSREMRE